MKTFVSAVSIFAFCLAALSYGDEILFKNGKSISGKVTEYKSGQITILRSDGKEITGGIDKIERIQFDTVPLSDSFSTIASDTKTQQKAASQKAPTSPAIRSQITKAIDSAKKTLRADQAIVAMYLDTAKPSNEQPKGGVGYRCFAGNGYSGDERVPLQTAWTRAEFLTPGSSGLRTIKLDPGPPYENVEFDVELTPGKVTDLGRIVFKQVQVTGTASIAGIVKDLEGKPIPDVSLTAGNKKTKSGPDGRYQMDGFGLSNVSVMATKSGYFGVPSNVSIRNMDERLIVKDVIVSRPIKLKLEFVVSSSGSDSFDGPGVERGVTEISINKPFVPLDQLEHSSKSFEQFVNDARLSLTLLWGDLRLHPGRGPIFTQATSMDFESVKKAGTITSQQWPEINKESTFIVRGFSKIGEYAVSQHCIKFRVVELSFE